MFWLISKKWFKFNNYVLWFFVKKENLINYCEYLRLGMVIRYLDAINVSISDLKTAEAPAVLQTILGSCIAICLWDPGLKIGSLAHALLPARTYSSAMSRYNPKKYVDSLIELQLKELQAKGVMIKNLVAKITGGANMFAPLIPDTENHVGKKNARKAVQILERYSIPIKARDTGSFFGRKIEFNLSTGVVNVYKTGELWKVL